MPKPKKKFNVKYTQNFIKHASLAKYVVNSAKIPSSNKIIEIGAGNGIITKELIDSKYRFDAIEIDKVLYEDLKRKYQLTNDMKILNLDFFDYRLPINEPFSVISNLPFANTSEIINKILMHNNPPMISQLIVQKEAAQSLVGKTPSYNKNNQPAIKYKPWYNSRILRFIPRSSYEPRPSVMTALINISLKSNPDLEFKDRYKYSGFISKLYSSWQPSVYKSLKKIFTYNQLTRIKKEHGDVLNLKPKELDYEVYLELYKTYASLYQDK